MTKTWHVSVGFKITDRKVGYHCGYIGLATSADSEAEGYVKALEWLRRPFPRDSFLLYTPVMTVQYF